MKYIPLVILALMLTACGGKIENAAQNQTVIFANPVQPSENSERLLEELFLASDIPWDDEMVARIESARISINANTLYIKKKVNLELELPYYSYKSWFEFISNQYMLLQAELDEREKLPGAISEYGKELYWYVKRDIHTMLDLHRTKISMTEKSIEDKASADTTEDMKNIYAVIKPLVGLAL